MNSKKLIQCGVIIVTAVWIFCISLYLGLSSQQTPPQEQITVTTAPVSTATTASPSTTAATATQSLPTVKHSTVEIEGNRVTAAPTADMPDWKKEEETSIMAENAEKIAASMREESQKAAEKASKKAEELSKQEATRVPSGKQDVMNAYCTAVNRLKNEKNFLLLKKDVLSVSIDSITGGSMVQGIANKLVESNSKNEPETYRFENGNDAATGMSPNQVIAPINMSANLSNDIVTSARAEKRSGGGYNIEINLGESVQTLTAGAPGYDTSMEVINVDSLGLPENANITQLDITYNNSRIEAEVDGKGRIVAMRHMIVVTHAEGQGRMLVPVSVKLHGDCVSEYTISY